MCTIQYIAQAVEIRPESLRTLYDFYMAVMASASHSEADVQAALQVIDLPKGVRLKAVMFDVDSTGDDAVYIVFAVSKQLGLGPVRIRSLGDLKDRVLSAVDELNLGRLVYVRFIDVK